jgi:hypothetical protein
MRGDHSAQAPYPHRPDSPPEETALAEFDHAGQYAPAESSGDGDGDGDGDGKGKTYVYTLDSMSSLLSSVGNKLSGWFNKSPEGKQTDHLGESGDDVIAAGGRDSGGTDVPQEGDAQRSSDESAVYEDLMARERHDNYRRDGLSDSMYDGQTDRWTDGRPPCASSKQRSEAEQGPNMSDPSVASTWTSPAATNASPVVAAAKQTHTGVPEEEMTSGGRESKAASDSDTSMAPAYEMVEQLPMQHYSGTPHGAPSTAFIRAVQRDLKLLQCNLPDGVYVRSCESRVDLLRAAIVGPTKTPYEDGFFVFDVYLPPEYPQMPPQVRWKHVVIMPGCLCASVRIYI